MTTDAWWLETNEPDTKPAETEEARTQRLAEANDGLSWAMHSIQQGLVALNVNLASALEAHTDALDYAALADTVAWLQARKAELAEAEAYVARELGRLEGCPDSIELTDGRRADVMKGRERKEWRHDDWKRDVRLKLVGDMPASLQVLDTETGTTTPLDALALDLIAKAQAVHGSAAPKTTALKPLGLAADDYCTSYPGPYTVRISAPETQEN